MNYGTSAAEIAGNTGLDAIWDVVLAINGRTQSLLSQPALQRDRLAWLCPIDPGYRTSVLSSLDEIRATVSPIFSPRRTTPIA